MWTVLIKHFAKKQSQLKKLLGRKLLLTLLLKNLWTMAMMQQHFSFYLSSWWLFWIRSVSNVLVLLMQFDVYHVSVIYLACHFHFCRFKFIFVDVGFIPLFIQNQNTMVIRWEIDYILSSERFIFDGNVSFDGHTNVSPHSARVILRFPLQTNFK